jgi:hypothetical protein
VQYRGVNAFLTLKVVDIPLKEKRKTNVAAWAVWGFVPI